MKTLYLDLFSGISGDMFLGALIDLGVDARKLERELKKLQARRLALSQFCANKNRASPGLNSRCRWTKARPTGMLTIPLTIITTTTAATSRKSNSSFRAAGFPIGRRKNPSPCSGASPKPRAKFTACRRSAVHFHEVGAVDSIVDIVGAMHRAGNAWQAARVCVAGRRRHRLD